MNMKDPQTVMNRREFIRWSVRLLLLGGLFALVFRHGSSRRETQDVCTDPKGYCRTCSALEYCGHPTARSFKNAVKQEEGSRS